MRKKIKGGGGLDELEKQAELDQLLAAQQLGIQNALSRETIEREQNSETNRLRMIAATKAAQEAERKKQEQQIEERRDRMMSLNALPQEQAKAILKKFEKKKENESKANEAAAAAEEEPPAEAAEATHYSDSGQKERQDIIAEENMKMEGNIREDLREVRRYLKDNGEEMPTLRDRRGGGEEQRELSTPDSKGCKKTSKKEVLGKMRCIYKIPGDRKEYVKYKGKLITVKDYKMLNKKPKTVTNKKPKTVAKDKKAKRPKKKST